MCHRYTISANPEEIALALHPSLLNYQLPFWSDRDVFPLASVPVIREQDEWELVPMQWGLLPFWWKAGKGARSTFQRKTFNACSETIHEKPSFRAAFKSRRCLIPAMEFYEGGQYFRLKDSEVLFLAGLWESCKVEDEKIETCTIITTNANDMVSEYHPRDRMPVILPDDDSRRLWMSPDVVEREPLEELFVPLDDALMSHRAE